jgi:heme/copper-type cytochrome/quinol oxidase subunit 2
MLYQPYVISIITALIITLIAYFIINYDNKLKENDGNNKKNNTLTLLIIFIVSFLGIMMLKYLLDYANKNNIFQKGGNKLEIIKDNLTIIDDDIDIDII